MKFTIKQIAEILNGTVEGNLDASVWKLSKIEEGSEGSLSFLANPLYKQYLYSTEATAVIVNNDFVPEQALNTTLIRVEDAYGAFAKLLEFYNQVKLNKIGISKLAFINVTSKLGDEIYVGEFACIGENVVIGNNVKIYPHVYIGDNTTIGNNTTLYSGVKIYSDIVIGNNCILHSGVIIGADGFGFAPQADNNYNKVAQIGNVIIEDNVEIGANTTIDRATLGSTLIKKGVKLDNQIQIAHNVVIGENTVIVSQTGIAGSTKIGKNCMIAGQVGIVGHLNIGDNVKIAAQSGITSNVKDGEIIMGSPAFNINEYRKVYVHFRNLTKLVKKIDELEKQIKELKK